MVFAHHLMPGGAGRSRVFCVFRCILRALVDIINLTPGFHIYMSEKGKSEDNWINLSFHLQLNV